MKFKKITSLFLCLILTFVLASCTTNKDPIVETYYSVTFETNLGTNISQQKVKAGDKASKPESPTKTDYTFNDWYSNSALSGNPFSFDTVINSDITLFAKWNPISKEGTKYTVTINFDNGSDSLTLEVLENGKVTQPAEPKKTGYKFSGWFNGELAFNFDSQITSNIIITAKWNEDALPEGYTAINTKEDLLNLFKTGGEGKYQLRTDIDLIDTEISGSTVDFSGILDGNEHTISNFHAVAEENKQGAFFKRVVNGTIKNLKIVNSSMKSGGNGEGTAFIAHAAHGAATFENLEFTNVKVLGNGSYTSLVFADTAGDTQTDSLKLLDRIIVNNNFDHPIVGSAYTGGLVGHIRTTAQVKFNYIYFNSRVLSNNPSLNQIAGSLIGRVQGRSSTITVDQAVIKGETSATKDVGGFIGNSVVTTTLKASNVWFENYTASVSSGDKVNTLIGNVNKTTLDLSKVYYNEDTTKISSGNNAVTSLQGESVSSKDLSQTWFDHSGLSKAYFKLENGKIQLNRVSGPKTEESISIFSDSIPTTYNKGETLNIKDLIVKVNYSDASNALLDASDYQVNAAEVDLTTPGIYYLHVTYKEFTAKVAIKVIEVTGFTVYTIDFNHVALINTEINLKGIVLNANLSDGNFLILPSTDYTIDTSSVDLTKEGMYKIVVRYQNFEAQEINFFVSKKLTSDDATVFVNKNTTSVLGVSNEDNIVFPTLQAAVNYLTLLNLPSEAKKLIAISDGIYHEKVTIEIPNLTVIGQSQDKTIITYNMANGSPTPLGSTWGTGGSATLTIKPKATNFTLANLSVRNDFDYYNSPINDKQAVAVSNTADKTVFSKVTMTSMQDTLYASQGRQWYIDNHIEGAVDYIFGNGGPSYFEQNVIHTIYRSNADGVITAQKGENNAGKALTYGYVFYNNTLTTDNTARPVLFGRPWGPIANVMFIENKLQKDITTGWTDMSGNKPENAFFYEYKNTIGGELVENTTHGRVMTDAEALAAINKANVFSTTNGKDTFTGEWDYEAQLAYVIRLLNGHN